MQKELISIIIPVYNVKAYLAECIESVIQQTYQNIEILLVDDGSTDGSADICDEFGRKDTRVKVFHKVNGGVASARNYGLVRAEGKLIGFVDADDMLHPQMYELLYNDIETNNAMLAYCLMQRMYGTQTDNREADKPVVLAGQAAFSLKAHFGLTPRPHIGKSVCDKLFRREVLTGVCFDERYSLGEDNLFITQVLLKEPVCVYDGRALYFYRDVREGNSRSAGAVSNKMFTDQIPVKRLQIEMLQKSGYSEIAAHERIVFYKELLRYHEIIGRSSEKTKREEFYQQLRGVVLEEKEEIKKTLKDKRTNWKYRVKYRGWFVGEKLLRVLELGGRGKILVKK